MNKSIAANQIITEIISLRDQYQAEVGSKRKPWPKSIKDRVLVLARMNFSMQELSNKTKIPYQSIMSWRQADQKQNNFHTLTVRNPTVTVGAQEIPTESSEKVQDPTVMVRTPDGFTLEIPSSICTKILLEIRGQKCF